MAPATQSQVAALLKSLLAKGIDMKDAAPTVKALVEAKIFSLHDLTPESNLPATISSKIRAKLLPADKKRKSSSSTTTSQKKKRPSIMTEISMPPSSTRPTRILVNRSPVLTLWGTVVAQHLYDLSLPLALTLGSSLAAQVAQSKGRTLGIFEKCPKPISTDSTSTVTLLGQVIPIKQTEDGIIGLVNEVPQDASKTFKLLHTRFGSDLGFVYEQMMQTAKTAGSDLEATAYQYYVHIRPDIPAGTKGWGAHGYLECSKLSDYYKTISSEATNNG